jgi:hypothetical protein
MKAGAELFGSGLPDKNKAANAAAGKRKTPSNDEFR